MKQIFRLESGLKANPNQICRSLGSATLVVLGLVPLLIVMFSSSASAGLALYRHITGKVVVSSDGGGGHPALVNGQWVTSYDVDIIKPSAGATVREAHLFIATTGRLYPTFTPVDEYVALQHPTMEFPAPVTWDATVASSIASFNARSDVTDIVRDALNGHDIGNGNAVTITIIEEQIEFSEPTYAVQYDGCILTVIWDDPTTTQNSILVFFGAQETTGDSFVMNFAAPLSSSVLLPSAPPMEFSLGISHSHQNPPYDEHNPPQLSYVDVNGSRLTSSAGGEDDGVFSEQGLDGDLMTVGGTGDSWANPPDAFAQGEYQYDDELYDLKPFASAGNTSMTIWTLNPSNDDNIFFASVFLRNVTVASSGSTAPSVLAGGWDHSLAVKTDGTVWSWGGTMYGQLGRNGDPLVPDEVDGLPLGKFGAVAAGGWHSLALRASDGAVWAWGYNYYGQLGNGSTANSPTPVQVKGPNGVGTLSGIVAISAGSYNSYAVKSDGTVWAWGYGGALGNGSSSQSPHPVRVLDVWEPSGILSGVVAISGGDAHCLALKSDGTVRAWGHNTYGQLGIPTNLWPTSLHARKVFDPTDPSGDLTGVRAIAAGGAHSIALKAIGSVWSWGNDSYGQLGDGEPAQHKNYPVNSGLAGVRSISAGWNHSLAATGTGFAWVWGRSHTGQLGLGSDTETKYAPVQNLQEIGFATVVAGKMSHSLAIKGDRKLRGWGANFFGQVGDGTTDSPKPSPVPLAPNPPGFGL